MLYNKDKVDEMTLALLYLVMTKDKEGTRAWKGFDWEAMNPATVSSLAGRDCGMSH